MMTGDTDEEQTEVKVYDADTIGDRDSRIFSVMRQRTLNEHETSMLAKRDLNYNIRKVLEKILYMLPSIMYAIASLRQSYLL